MPTTHYDAVVIGAGQGGDPMARALANAGKKTAIIERRYVGGTCVNTGCTPTKALYNTARVAYLARRAADFGVKTGPVDVDMHKVWKRVQGIVQDFRAGTEKKIQKTENLTLIYGQAQFTGPKTIRVDGQEIEADQIFINTGTRAFIPPIPGLADVGYLDNATILQLQELPAHLLVLGGGYIGLEFAQMFRRLGSQVTLIEKAPRLIEREDQDASDVAKQILEEDGIQVHLGAEVRAVRQKPNEIEIDLAPTPNTQGANEIPDEFDRTKSGNSTPSSLKATHLLVAIGRTPNTDDLALDKAKVEVDDRGYVAVNDKLETSAPNIYAIGDVKGGPAFTHISYDDFRILEENLLHNGHRSTKDRPVPYVMFLDPQLGRVGLNEKEANDKGINVQVAKLDATSIARAIEMGETRGFIKALVDDQDHIVGATTFCVEGGELLAPLQLAIQHKLPYQALRNAVLSHPTLSESLNNLFMTIS